jgi:hypothetical protein
MIINSLSGDEARTKNFVFLSFRKGMVMFPPLGKGDRKPECKSNDRITGSLYGRCEDCRYRHFEENETGDKIKPRCRALYDFLVMSENQTIPYAMSISTPTSQGPVKKLITYFIEANKPMFSQITCMTFEQKTNQAGQPYYVIKFSKVKELTADEMKIYRDLMERYRIKPVIDEEVIDSEDDLPGTELPF